MMVFHIKSKSCIAHAQNIFTTDDYNKLKITKIECNYNEHSNNYVLYNIYNIYIQLHDFYFIWDCKTRSVKMVPWLHQFF